MKRMLLILGISLMILPWLAGARVQAGAIQWSASGSAVGTDGLPNVVLSNNDSNSGIGLLPDPTIRGANAGKVVFTLSAFDNSSNDLAGKYFGGSAGNYSLSLELRNLASGASGSLTFRGNLSGFFNIEQTEINNTFIGPTTQTLTLGKNLYTVTVGPFVSPGPPEPPMSGSPGSISASIAVQPVFNSVPEPSSLILACLGFSSLGLAGWRRRHRCRKVVDGDTNKA